jgi:hypothetical protein
VLAGTKQLRAGTQASLAAPARQKPPSASTAAHDAVHASLHMLMWSASA